MTERRQKKSRRATGGKIESTKMSVSQISVADSSASIQWITCSRYDRCRICDRPRWCGYSADGRFAICMKIEAGSIKRTLNDGYLHRLDSNDPIRPRRPKGRTRIIMPPAPIRSDIAALARSYQSATNPILIERFASKLSVSAESLMRLGIGWAFDWARRRSGPMYDAGDSMLTCGNRYYSFPMSDGHGQIVGIRLRSDASQQISIAGSRSGLFVPTDLPLGQLLIVEGQSDTAALLDMGFSVVGRPSCVGGTAQVVDLIQRRKINDVVIFSDGDAPGRRGAEALASVLVLYTKAVRIIEPPADIKDARAWKIAGATAEDVKAAIEAAPTRQVKIRRLEVSR
jgi:5S rRNA maturation endonuclease (ribonuclease M5)